MDKKGRVKKSQKQKKKIKTQADEFNCSHDLLRWLGRVFQGYAHEQTIICRQSIWRSLVGRHATAVLNSIDPIKFNFSTVVVRRLKPSRATAV